jgi:hypothetical protein
MSTSYAQDDNITRLPPGCFRQWRASAAGTGQTISSHNYLGFKPQIELHALMALVLGVRGRRLHRFDVVFASFASGPVFSPNCVQ